MHRQPRCQQGYMWQVSLTAMTEISLEQDGVKDACTHIQPPYAAIVAAAEQARICSQAACPSASCCCQALPYLKIC